MYTEEWYKEYQNRQAQYKNKSTLNFQKETKVDKCNVAKTKSKYGAIKCEITIPLMPVTKKNSQQIVMNGNRPRIIQSSRYLRYEKDCAYFMPCIETINKPVKVTCLYYMPTHRRTDLTNLMEATHDILVKYKVLEDDNYKIIDNVDGSRVYYDKENPRTEIYIEEVTNDK